MALTHCPYCGHVVSTSAERCPSCGAPVMTEISQPVETPPSFAGNQPQPAPQPAQNTEPDFDFEESHTGRNIIIIVVLLLLAAAGGFYYYLHSGPNRYESVVDSMDTVAVDYSMLSDSASMDTSVAEPEETLEVSSQRSGAKQLLATYRYGGLRRDYYWESEVGKLSIYDENGTCLKKHKLDIPPYGVYDIDAVVKLYNHHVYFAGVAGGGSGGIYYVIFYLTPQDGNGFHVIEDFARGEYEFQENSVRVRRLKLLNGDTAECNADYKYEESWETIPLQ